MPDDFVVPEGFCVGKIGSHNQPYMVPAYLLPALEQAIRLEEERKNAGVERTSDIVSQAFLDILFNAALQYVSHISQYLYRTSTTFKLVK